MNEENTPLAEKLRPQTLAEIVGQEHLTSEGGVLKRFLSLPRMPSLIFWGPPGTGKTSLARILATHIALPFEAISAVFAGVADLRRIFEGAQKSSAILLFVDEIHRFNKAQQDSLLGPMESGLITLIGATTENPSFSLNSAILSRARVLVLKPLGEEALGRMLEHAEATLGAKLPLTGEARSLLLSLADSDGRMLMSMVEILATFAADKPLTSSELLEIVQKRAALYDKSSEFHYNLISAFIKSLRGSDPDAALYWMARMLGAGEEPLFLARRMIRFATEDVGLADPGALQHALAAYQAFERLGSPEGELSLANAALYLATAPKSNAAYTAWNAARPSAEKSGSLPPPKIILNAPTKLMKAEGYGQNYIYDHDTPHFFSGQNYFPDGMPRENYYSPKETGFEREISKRLQYWQKLRDSHSPHK